MLILLVAATKFEIQPYLADNKHVDVLIAGVGVPSTLYHLQKRLSQVDYDFVIQAGIAGAFNSEPKLGEVVLVNKDTFGDIGLEEKGDFQTIFSAGFADPNVTPFTNGWLVNSQPFLEQLSLMKCSAVTINKVTDNPIQKQQLESVYQPQIETMEGAALHYVCLQEKIPFIQIRGISNAVGERDKSKWQMKDAIANLNLELNNLINQLIS